MSPRPIAWMAALLVAAPLLLAALALRTDRGRDRLASELEVRLGRAAGGPVSVRGLAGRLPGEGRVAELRIADARGEWLVASNIAWRASLFDGWRWRPRVHACSVADLIVLRRPGREPGPAGAPGPLGFELAIETARVHRLRATEAAAGRALDLDVAGSAAVARGELRAAGRAKRNDGAGAAAVEARGAPDRGWQVDLAYEEAAAGWICAAWPGDGATACTVRASLAGIDATWTGEVAAAVGASDHLRGAWRFDAGVGVSCELTGRVDKAAGGRPWTVEALALDWRRAAGGGEGSGSLRGTGAGVPVQAEFSLARAASGALTARVDTASPGLHVKGHVRQGASRALELEMAFTNAALADAWIGRAVEGRGQAHVTWTREPGAEDAFDVALAASEIRTPWGAVAAASLSATGSSSRSVLRARLERAEPVTPAEIELAPADLVADLEYAGRRLRGECRVEGWTDAPARARIDLPMDLAFDGSRTGLRPDDTLSADFDAALDLARLARAADLRGNRAEGRVEVALRVAGTPAQPDVRGTLAWRDGRVEAPASGTVLDRIAVTLEGDRERLVIREATARDGGEGRVTVAGAVWFRPSEGFPVDARVQLRRAELWRRGGSLVRLDGALDVAGSLQSLQVTGELKAVDSRIALRASRPAAPVLPVAGLAAPEAPPSRAPSAWRHRVALDVRLRARDLEVAGRGLQSLWRADLRARGRADAPKIEGTVSVDRGYFLFMGRRFTLGRGVLSLDGRHPPQPMLSAEASSRAGEMTATLRVEGPAEQPVLALESDPAYPVDEILSRLLFGKSTDAITAFQAVRLAHGLSLLRGRGTTLDVLERGQSLLRVDQLELKQDENTAELSALSVGKYVGRSVYVQGQKGLGGAEDVISVEVELTPSLILQTETSPRIREGVGLQWRRDY